MKKINQLPRKALEILAIEFGYGNKHGNNLDEKVQEFIIRVASDWELADYISRSI